MTDNREKCRSGLLLALLLLTNIAWAIAYRSLWYDAAQAEGMLDQAESYIHQELHR